MHELVLFIAGFMAALIGTMSGGGAGLLSLSTLLWLGLPINQAVATNKLGDLGFFLPALRNFTKAKQINKKALPPIIAINLVGVILGTLLITRLNINAFKILIILILLAVIFSSLINKKHTLKQRPPKRYWSLAYFSTSITAGLLGAGTGILSTLTLLYLRGFNALQAMAHSFYANAIGSLVGLSILLFTDLIDYHYVAPLLLGNLIGSHFGSKIAIKKGSKFVQSMILFVAIFVVMQLAFF